jgi:uncharacterized protein (TIGR03000 family)
MNYFAYPPAPAAVPTGPPATAPATPNPTNPGLTPAAPKPDKISAASPANVVVILPADAVLFANGVRTAQTSSERHFVTPPLNPGQSYNYILTAEIKRNNEPITETYQVEVQAGLETRVNFARLIASSPKDASRIAKK